MRSAYDARSAYFNDTPVRVIERAAIGVLVEWPNGNRSWLDAAEVQAAPKTARSAYLIQYELRFKHVDYDWWGKGDERALGWYKLLGVVARMHRQPQYRNIRVSKDPHDDHHGTIQHSRAGLSAWCTVEGCTWTWGYD